MLSAAGAARGAGSLATRAPALRVLAQSRDRLLAAVQEGGRRRDVVAALEADPALLVEALRRANGEDGLAGTVGSAARAPVRWCSARAVRGRRWLRRREGPARREEHVVHDAADRTSVTTGRGSSVLRRTRRPPQGRSVRR